MRMAKCTRTIAPEAHIYIMYNTELCFEMITAYKSTK
jgi:hypothetical protein